MRQRDELTAYNERVKLMSSTSNAVGLALLALGILRPAIDPDLSIGLTGMVYGALGVACHVGAHYVLKELRMTP